MEALWFLSIPFALSIGSPALALQSCNRFTVASVRHLHFFVEKNSINVFDCGEKKTARKMAEALLKLTESTSLRGKAVDGVHYFSVYDFLNFLTGHERGDEHARKVFLDLLERLVFIGTRLVTTAPVGAFTSR